MNDETLVVRQSTSRSFTEQLPEEIVALVFTHGDVARGVLEGVALDAERRATYHAAARSMQGRVRGVLAYSTCLRTEIYAVVEDAQRDLDLLRSLLTTVTGAPPATAALGRRLVGEAATTHLLRVASGLESVLVGEDEIHGQLREALRSTPANVVGPVLHRLFEAAAATGARVRHETALSSGRPALGRAAAHACGVPRDGEERRIALVVGAGTMGRQAARKLEQLGWRNIAVANRTVSRARELAHEVGGSWYVLDELPSLMARAAVVITAVSDSPNLIGEAALLRAQMAGRYPRAIVDLASPRNVAPAVRAIPQIAVTDLDGFAEAAEERRAAQATAIPMAESIVAEEGHRFAAWWQHRRLVPLVRRLRESVQSAAAHELESLLQGRSASECEAMRRLSHAMVNRLLHHPLRRLQEIAGANPERIGALCELEALFAPQGEEVAQEPVAQEQDAPERSRLQHAQYSISRS